MMEDSHEVFQFCGQTRYRCNRAWPTGGKCEYDTYDLELMDAHVHEVHAVKRPPMPPMPTLFDGEGKQLVRDEKLAVPETQWRFASDFTPRASYDSAVPYDNAVKANEPPEDMERRIAAESDMRQDNGVKGIVGNEFLTAVQSKEDRAELPEVPHKHWWKG
jgi:hypothetical protein